MKELSARQQHIIDFIHHFLDDRGYPPAIRDIQAGCGISSTSVVDYNLKILAKEGHIRLRLDAGEIAGVRGRLLNDERWYAALATLGRSLPTDTEVGVFLSTLLSTVEAPRSLSCRQSSA